MGRHGELFIGEASVSPALPDSPPTSAKSRPRHVPAPGLTTSEPSVTLFAAELWPFFECPFTGDGEWAFVLSGLGPGGIEKREM